MIDARSRSPGRRRLARLAGRWSASTSRRAAPPTRRRRPRTRASPGLARPATACSEIAEQFSLSALDGAACQLGVSRERLAQALATRRGPRAVHRALRHRRRELARAIRAGLLRAVDDAEEAGALSPFIAGPLRDAFEHIPLDQAIELVNDAGKILNAAESFLGPAGDMIEELLP